MAGCLSDLLKAHVSASTLEMTSTLHVLRVSDILSMVEGFLFVWLQEDIYTFYMFI